MMKVYKEETQRNNRHKKTGSRQNSKQENANSDI